jgi:hypothetical protein
LTIKQEIRDKIIQMSQHERKGRNIIAHELDISQGSVSNILREWKEGKNQTTNEIASSETDISTTQWHGEGVASSPINITDDVRNSEPDVDFSDFSYQEILM